MVDEAVEAFQNHPKKDQLEFSGTLERLIDDIVDVVHKWIPR